MNNTRRGGGVALGTPSHDAPTLLGFIAFLADGEVKYW